jgi:hypothetical protein
MFVLGLTLQTTDRYAVIFGDWTSGIVQKIGWMQTIIHNFDEKIEVVHSDNHVFATSWVPIKCLLTCA